MIERLQEILTKNGYTKYELGLEFDIYASIEQVFVVKVFNTEDELVSQWNATAREVALEIQNKLRGILDLLRWDIYLLLCVTEENVQSSKRFDIENDRSFFRKIILTSLDEPYEQRLPFASGVNIIRTDEPKTVLFDDSTFLYELKPLLSDATKLKLGTEFFADGLSNTENQTGLVERFFKTEVDE